MVSPRFLGQDELVRRLHPQLDAKEVEDEEGS